MTLTAQFLHSRPQHALASLLSQRFSSCQTASVVAGFVTPDGVDALQFADAAHAPKITRFVVGAGTYRAFAAVDRMIAAGVLLSGVRVHLGHGRLRGRKFHKYHPMMHSKIYLFEMDDGSASAFIGSHNVTGFALRGLNGEAGVLLEGSISDPSFIEVGKHIDEAYSQATQYDPSMKEAYAWWTREYFDGLRIEANDEPRDSEFQRTIVIIAAQSTVHSPQKNDVVYFEIAEELSEIRSLDSDVHIYLFSALPRSPSQALSQLNAASASLSCRTEGLEIGRGGLELDADWYIDDRKSPNLKPTSRPFRPRTSPGMQQVRVRVAETIQHTFEYLFDTGKNVWVPEFDQDEVRDEVTKESWRRVKGLSADEVAGSEPLKRALIEASPESGSFVLFSRRRRRTRG